MPVQVRSSPPLLEIKMDRRHFFATIPGAFLLQKLAGENLGYPGIRTALHGNRNCFYADGFERELVQACHVQYKNGGVGPFGVWNKNIGEWCIVSRETPQDLTWEIKIASHNTVTVFVNPNPKLTPATCDMSI